MADQKISKLTALSALPATNDYFVVLDTDASATKKVAANYLYHDWASHTATVTASSGTITTASASNRYFTLHGKTRFLQGLAYITTAGTGAGNLRVTIPSGVPATFFGGLWSGWGRSSIGAVVVTLAAGGSYMDILLYDNSTTIIANGVSVSYGIIYELA